MKVMTFDLETENHVKNKRKASPYDLRNYIVQIGWSVNGGEVKEKYYEKWHRDPVLPCMDGINVLVGLNIKFDLEWVWKEPELLKFLKRGGTIYCCQLAEYMLGGMTPDVQMVSMNSIAEGYGGGCKVDAVKEMWDDGFLTSEIPRDLLTDYLCGDGKKIVGDVHNTWLIYIGQVRRILADHPPEFRTMLKFRMDSLLATTEMQHNGVRIHRERAEELREGLVADIEVAQAELDKFIPELPPELEFKWSSSQKKSCLIFGGTVKYLKWVHHKDEEGNLLFAQKKTKWPLFNIHGEVTPVPPEEAKQAGKLLVIEVDETFPNTMERNGKYYLVQERFKTGKNRGAGKFKIMTSKDMDKPKGAQQDHFFTFEGYVKNPKPSWKGESTDAYDNPLYSTAEDVIEELGTMGLSFTDALIKNTKLTKDLSTYYWTEGKNGKRKGMLTLLGDDDIIHHQLNHVNTVTGRMSSKNPNLQNVPRGKTSNVKQMFKSRFKDGKIVEIDYSQLEVVVMAVLTKDKQLTLDLQAGVDMHCKRLAAKLHEDYEHVLHMCKVVEDPEYGDMRTKAKEFSFQRAYGAGKVAIAGSTGMTEQEVGELITAEEKLYPGIVRFDARIEQRIALSSKDSGEKLFVNGVAMKKHRGSWDSPTGTRYTWLEGITPDFMHKQGKYVGFSPTERKNYPPQGFGGEIVQMQLGKVFRYFLENDFFNGEVLLTNTVHDCLILDGHGENLLRVARQVKAIMESVPESLNEAYPKMDVVVPFPCELEMGDTWFNMEVVHDK